ncbi:MAG: TlpA family protein disulfide reductase [Candidatus Eisenbacteria bacterium]|uniref:TlpA family protein disulfide reductase n=1 Tax=Eiseniibacteriota bacterium TaxID=2212470 RepID=A0A956RQR4_UNCEI|nr:TlpA family protein disulfide reductase [Candidatus Eisenbacteria bacterium]
MRLMPNLPGRRWIVGSALVGLAWSWALGPTALHAEGGESLSTAPNFKVEGLDGKTYQLSDFLAKGPVFLDFWTTWCKPCMLELPELEKLQKKYADRGFTLLTVASDDRKTAAKVKPLVKQRGFEFPVLLDSKRDVGNQYNVRQYPTSYLIEPDGKIASVHVGYKPGDENAIEKELLELLPESAPAMKSEGGGEN